MTGTHRPPDAAGPPAATGPPLVADLSGHGPVVVALHGQPGSAADWDPVVGLLARDHTVVTPDRPGYGRTGGRALDFAGNADAVVALLDRLEIDEAIVVGHSWGGGVALALAGAHPGRVAGLVLLASPGPSETIGPVDRLLASRPLGDLTSAVTIGGTERLLAVPGVRRHLLPLLPGPAQGVLSTLRRPGGRGARLSRSFAAEQRYYVEGVASLAAGLGRIAAPTTVVTGDSDRIVSPGVAVRLAAAIPEAELIRVPGVGHMLARDAPRAVTDAVTRTVGRAMSS